MPSPTQRPAQTLSAILLVMIVVALVSVSRSNVQAQDTGSCDAFIDLVITELSNNCASTDENTVCYGFEEMDATFFETDTPVPPLNAPADRAPLTELLSLETAPFNVAGQTWGLAHLRTYANLAATLAEYGAIYLLVGDARLVNTVDPETALILPEEPVVVRVSGDGELWSFPPEFGARASELVGRAGAGEALNADGVSADGEWVRVAHFYNPTINSRRSTAWITTASLEENADLETLPVITPESRAPFQEVFFTASPTVPACETAPLSEMLTQSPGNIEVDLYVNGLNVRIYSTIIFRIADETETGAMMRIIPLVGHAYLPAPETPDIPEDGILVPASQFIDVPVVLVDDGDDDETTKRYELAPDFYEGFAQFRQDYEEATDRGETLVDERILIRLYVYENLPENIMNYVPDVIDIIRPSGVGSPQPIYTGGRKPPILLNP